MVCKRYTEEQIIQVVREMSRAYSEKDYVRSGIMAGVIGIVMAIFMMMATATTGKGLLAFPQMIGESFPERAASGRRDHWWFIGTDTILSYLWYSLGLYLAIRCQGMIGNGRWWTHL